MKRNEWLLCFLLLCLPVSLTAQIKQLSNDATFSLLTIAPSDDEVYTVYGHTGLRVNDPFNGIDKVFNYGIFDFSKPNFLYRFTKGETDYRLGAADFPYFMMEYNMRGSTVIEQILNLSPEEKLQLWEALLINNQPENQVYRYNFFFDNCATRPATMIEKYLNGNISIEKIDSTLTFRDMINECTKNHPWMTFGCDLALGAPTDRPITEREALFLPLYLLRAYEKAIIINPDNSKRDLVTSSRVISNFSKNDDTLEETWLTPNLCCWTFFLLILLITIVEAKRKTYYRIIDCILFFIYGIGGVVLYFLCFVSTHPCIWPNWSIIWLQPFHLLAVILFAVKKFGKAAYYYHFINFAALSLLLIGWYFIPQHLNTAFIPLILVIWLRSGYAIYRKIWKIV